MADFVAVIRRAVESLAENTPEMRVTIYERAHGAVQRQLDNMRPRPPEAMLERQIQKLEAAILQVEREHGQYEASPNDTTAYWDLEFSADAAPMVPELQLGPSFNVSPNGRLELATLTIATSEDIHEIGVLRSGLRAAIDDLVTATDGSNSFLQINKIARQYGAALYNDEGQLEVEPLYMHGVRLQNLAKRIDEMIASNDYPQMSVAVAEALDSIVALHGPTIMSMAAGRTLVEKAQQYTAVPERDQKYKDVGLALTGAVAEQGILETDTLDELAAINQDIDTGPSPNQSTDLARTVNANLVTKCAKIAIVSLASGAGYVATKGLADSELTATTVTAFSHAVDKIWAFFAARPEMLLELAKLSGADLSWLPAFLRWAEVNRVEAAAKGVLLKTI